MRVRAAVVRDGKFFYSDAEPPQVIMQSFRRRSDNQIMCLEILSIAFGMLPFRLIRAGRACVWYGVANAGLSTLCDLIRERNVIIWSDNRGAECATAKGSAVPFRVRLACSVKYGACRRHETV